MFQMTNCFHVLLFTGIEVEDKSFSTAANELVLDGGFSVPESNAFGHTFR